MPSEPLIALALSLLISLAPFLPAAEKSAPEEEPAPLSSQILDRLEL